MILNKRYQAAAMVAINWRIRARLPRVTALARKLGLIQADEKEVAEDG